MTARDPLSALQEADQAALAQALRALDAVLAEAIEQQVQLEGVASSNDPWRGLHLSAEQAQALLVRPDSDPSARDVVDRLAEAAADVPRWARATEALDLQALDLAILLLLVAPDLSLRYGRLYGYLQDDLSRRRPGADLLARLLARTAPERALVFSRLCTGAPLHEWGFIAGDDQAGQAAASPAEQDPWLAQGLRLDPMWVSWLQGHDALDEQTARFARVLDAHELPLGPQPLGPLVAEPPALSELAAMLERARQGQGVVRLWLHGPAGMGQHTLAHATAQAMGAGLLLVDLGTGAERPTVVARVQRGARAAWLLGHLPCFVLDGSIESPPPTRGVSHLGAALAGLDGTWVALSEQADPPASGVPVSALRLALGMPSAPRRQALWTLCLQQRGLSASPTALHTVASRFVLGAAQIAQAASDLQLQRHLHPVEPQADPPAEPSPSRDKPLVGLHELTAVARAQSAVALGPLAQRVTPGARFDALVCVPDVVDQLRDIGARLDTREQVRDWCGGTAHARATGISALFVGASGTGKTLAAEALAGELGLDLLRIDLSGVVSKYIGETEKNLDRVFTVASRANAVLFFDEADALFGKRSEVKDARDRYANIEVAYLLQKMEQFDGLAILATNLKQNLDDAFLRRLTFSVHFPFPEAPERLRLWQALWPRHAPCADDVDLSWLAGEYRLSGGSIRNAVVAAAHLAASEGQAISRAHLLHALRREFQKFGKNLVHREAVTTGAAA